MGWGRGCIPNISPKHSYRICLKPQYNSIKVYYIWTTSTINNLENTPRFYNFREMLKWQWRQRVVKETSIVKKIIQSTPYKPARFPGFIWHISEFVIKVVRSLNCWDIVLNWGNFIEQNNPHPYPLSSSQSWGVCCFLLLAGTVAQHCVEGGRGGGGGGSFIFPSLS